MDLHKEFVKLSFDIIKMKNRLISLLLEIYEQEIYKLHHCRTIYEYGFKYAKLSKEMVDKAIRTLKHLENKPFLKRAIETQGIHKVAMVATIATPENEQIFAGHVANLSKPALFELSRELRHRQKDGKVPQFCQAIPSKMTIELDAEMQILFLKFKEKYAKNLSNREALRVMLKRLDEVVGVVEVKADGVGDRAEVEEKEAVGNMQVKTGAAVVNCDPSGDENSVPGNGNQKHHEGVNSGKQISKTSFPSRYIQKKKNQEIRTKYQHKCAYPGCVKTVEVMHHRVPFSFERSHESIIPLCDVHHEFAHNGVIGHELKEPEEWTLKIAGIKSIYDGFYLDRKPGRKIGD